MKANELRIGNWVSTNKIQKVTIETLEFLSNDKFNHENVTPIPLTEEWLLKFGLNEFVEGFWQITIGVDKFCINKEGAGYKLSFMNYGIIKHVHQLQNLYFALTGEELTIKDEIHS